MFIRFVVGIDADHHRALTGVITEAYALQDRGELQTHEDSWLKETCDWLDKNLPTPPFKKKRWPKNAVCWFKDDAGDAVKRVWDIIALLKEHGVPVRMLRSKNPGKILYEDEFQVVVEEWKHL